MSSSNSVGDPADPAASAALLEVGRVEKAHGLNGEVVVRLVTNLVDRHTAAGAVLHTDDRELTVVGARPSGGRWLVAFDGVGDRTAADALRGSTLRAPARSTDGDDPGPPSASADHGSEVVALVHELIGRRVVDQRGVDHGPVVAVLDNPASDLLELGDGRLVPLTFYRGSDPATGTISVDVPDGLLDGSSD